MGLIYLHGTHKPLTGLTNRTWDSQTSMGLINWNSTTPELMVNGNDKGDGINFSIFQKFRPLRISGSLITNFALVFQYKTFYQDIGNMYQDNVNMCYYIYFLIFSAFITSNLHSNPFETLSQ
jgi:hypothetical protein